METVYILASDHKGEITPLTKVLKMFQEQLMECELVQYVLNSRKNVIVFCFNNLNIVSYISKCNLHNQVQIMETYVKNSKVKNSTMR